MPAPSVRRSALLTANTQVNHADIASQVTAVNRAFQNPAMSPLSVQSAVILLLVKRKFGDPGESRDADCLVAAIPADWNSPSC